jgi:hemerythrin
MVKWKASMSVGIDEIDEQHQEIIRRAGKFLESLADRSRQDTGILLSYLRNYCVTHFGAEEAWMRESSYPGRADHQKEHDGFIKELMRLSAEHEKPRGPGLKPAEVGQWIDEWLTSHVAGSDLELARHLRAHGLPARGEQPVDA